MRGQQKDIMRSLRLAYLTGDEKAYDRVSLRAFRTTEEETAETAAKGNVSDTEVVDFEGCEE